jgi:hypothetical protein
LNRECPGAFLLLIEFVNHERTPHKSHGYSLFHDVNLPKKVAGEKKSPEKISLESMFIILCVNKLFLKVIVQ